MKLFNTFAKLTDKDFDILKRRKTVFIIPAVIVALALVAGLIYGLTLGSPLNLGMDFTGGYSMNVKLSTKLTDENYDGYVSRIEDIFKNLADDDGENYGLKVASVQHQGAGESASIYVRYQEVKAPGVTDVQTYMESEVNVKLAEKLNVLFRISPLSVTFNNGAVRAEYPESMKELLTEIGQKARSFGDENGIEIKDDAVTLDANNNRIVYITAPAAIADKLSGLTDALSVYDGYSGQAIQGDVVSATVSGELLTNAILAVALAIVLMLVYIAFRFEVSSGVAAILALLHDVIVMFSFVTIFRIEINATFIAALITILGYSINNTIIIFDRIRENMKTLTRKGAPPSVIASTSVKETLLRSINTTVTTLITIAMVAIIGVPSIRVFALPIIIGLLAGTYSSIFISPSVWAIWKERLQRRANPVTSEKTAEKLTSAN
ncbi:MAG: protein translocase subunit SecF [Clostridiales bacterium]|jgi:preprotein translocase subunit SecF|nr:protein translocase subunit SecF [Clostridiales bacterium]